MTLSQVFNPISKGKEEGQSPLFFAVTYGSFIWDVGFFMNELGILEVVRSPGCKLEDTKMI
jgi:hypothetical protein